MQVDPLRATLLSLQVAGAAVLIGLAPALALGWLLARRRFPGRSLLQALLLAPLVLPPVVTGLLLLQLFGRAQPLGALLEALGLPIPFTAAGATLAALVVGFPLHVSSIRSAFEAVDPRLEELSRSLGLGPWQTWWRVSLPLALPGVAAGTLLAFARALGEFGATAVIAGNIEGRTRTIALAVYALMEDPQGSAAQRGLVLASLGLAALALLGHEALLRHQRRRLELDPA